MNYPVLVAREIWAGFEGEVRLTPGDGRCFPRSAGKTAPGPFISTLSCFQPKPNQPEPLSQINLRNVLYILLSSYGK